jgi:competence protein ComEC
VRVKAIRDGTDWLAADGLCQVLVDGHLLAIRAGDELNVFGHLGRPIPPMNPGEFDFVAHVRADGRLASLRCESPDCVTVIGRSPGHFLSRGRDALLASGKSSLRRYVGPDQAGLATAVLLGSREDLTCPHGKYQCLS